ncbi:helix-turn-helix transcriptional regulator [Streptosporangium sp. NPDC023963]|uniref:helix-turn-helix domain-containing protein n=1 Tax=Streptosporangium sp. NPDC023963 TaxID=3155608 RepID=UPI003416F391
MPERNTVSELPTRVREVRKRRGLSQKALAELSGLSESYVAKLEQGNHGEVRVETVRKLAEALQVTTSFLIGGRGDTEQEAAPDRVVWEQTYRALLGRMQQPDEEPTVDGVADGLRALKPLLADNRYKELATLLPPLLRDAEALNGNGRAVRSRLLNATGWVLTQTRQFDMAEPTLDRAIDLADDRLDAAAAVNTRVWLHLRQGQLDQARNLATRWADDIEPRFSRATTIELALWGRLLLGVSNAGVRDNRPGEAADAIRLARAAAAGIGHEALSDTSTTRTFGPVTVAMIAAENAAVLNQPDRVLAIAERIPADLPYAHSASRNRHRLDVASALVSMRKTNESFAVLQDLVRVSPEWLAKQRYARDIVGRLVAKRKRKLSSEMRELADAVGLAY